MKKNQIVFLPLFLGLTLLSCDTFANDEKFFCSMFHIYKYKSIVDQFPSERDKLKHCTLSCLVARKCPHSEIELVGFIKEIVDILGPGDPDPKDIEANRRGIKFSSLTKSESDCQRFCEQVY